MQNSNDLRPYAMYLRKSRLDKEMETYENHDSLERMEKTLTDLAKKLKISVTDIYREVVSGESIASRPEVQKLLDNVESGKYAGVLVVEVERLARGDTIDQGIVSRAFREGKAKIITPIKIYDPENEFDEEYFEFGLFMSRREYKTINRRIQRGRIQSVNDGKFIATEAPYGYDKVKIKDDKGFTLSPNEEEAPVVKAIYEYYLSGKGPTVIAKLLDEKGIKPRKAKGWSRASVRDILTNPVYAGKIRWSYKKEKKDPASGTKTRTRNHDCIITDGIHPQLITEDDFNKIQEMMHEHNTAPVQTEFILKNPLSGIVFCKKCGAPMTRLGETDRNKYATVKCPNIYCNNVSAPIFLIEQVLIKNLHEWLIEYKTKLEQGHKPVSDVDTKTLKSLKKELEKTEKQIEKTYDFLESGLYDAATFTKRNRTLSERTAELNTQISELEKRVSQTVSITELRDKIIPQTIESLSHYFELESAEDKNKLLKSILKGASYQKDAPNTRGKVNNINFTLDLFPRYPNI